MIKVREFRKEDLINMDMRAHEREILDPDVVDQADVVSLVDGDKIICILGKQDVKVWLLPSVYMKDYLYGVSRLIKREFAKYNNLVTTTYDDTLHARWMKFLGFDAMPNTTVNVFGDECLIYARVI